jgi:hypothetical protein
LNFSINTMIDFEHPFARNWLLTLGEWQQGSSVVDNNRIVLFLHGHLPLLSIFAIQRLFRGLRFFWVLEILFDSNSQCRWMC